MVKPFVTLRNVQPGWNASRELRALLAARRDRDEPSTQEWLADAAGISREQINGYAAGRLKIGKKNGERLAAALGVSLVELGAPAEVADDQRSQTLAERLDDLASRLGDAIEQQAKLTREVAQLRGRVRTLEAQREADAASAKRPRKAAR